MIPRLTVYRVADPRRFEVLWNRYSTGTIGATLIVGSRCFSLQWRRP